MYYATSIRGRGKKTQRSLLKSNLIMRDKQLLWCISSTWDIMCLTFLERCEEHLETASAAAFICPHSDYSKSCTQHHIISNRAAKFSFQIFYRTTSIINSNKIPFTFIWILHFIVQKSQVYLEVKKVHYVSAITHWLSIHSSISKYFNYLLFKAYHLLNCTFLPLLMSRGFLIHARKMFPENMSNCLS